MNSKNYTLNIIFIITALSLFMPYLSTDAHASLRRGLANRGVQVSDPEAKAAIELNRQTNIGVEKAGKVIKRLKEVGVVAPTADQKNAAVHLVDGLATENFTNVQLTNTVNLMTGVGGPPVPAPTLLQVNAAGGGGAPLGGGGAVVPPGWPAAFVIGAPITALQLAAGNYLLNGPGGAGAIIPNFTQAQLDATVELRNGDPAAVPVRAAIAAPTQDQVDAAVHLLNAGGPAHLPNFTTNQLNQVMIWQTLPNNCAVPSPTTEQIEATPDGSGIPVGGNHNAGPVRRPFTDYYPQLLNWLDANASETNHPLVNNLDPTKAQINIGTRCYRLSMLVTQVGNALGNFRPGGNANLTMAEVLAANDLAEKRIAFLHGNSGPVYHGNPALAADHTAPYPVHRALAPGNTFGGVPLPVNFIPAINIHAYELERLGAMIFNGDDE